ncbi:MAG: SBBP repeat-containing protein, partial [Planctomycetota bacterium]
YDIAVDSNDNIYVTGASYGSGTNYDYATIKYSPDSNQPVWVARYNGPGNSYDWTTST